jgi:predicted XRE-type DNA-binding protein
MTTADDMILVRESGNVFRDFDAPNSELHQLKAILAAQILKTLDGRNLSVRIAQALTGIDAGDFSRVRNIKLARFTVDRLMTMLDRLGQKVEVSVTVRPRKPATADVRAGELQT